MNFHMRMVPFAYSDGMCALEIIYTGHDVVGWIDFTDNNAFLRFSVSKCLDNDIIGVDEI